MNAAHLILVVGFLIPTTEQSASPTSIRIEKVQITLIKDVEVPARELGEVKTVFVKVGDRVKRGDILAQIDDSQAKLNQARAASELAIAQQEAQSDVKVRSARKSFAVYAADLKRAKESNVIFDKTISATELDRLQLLTEQATLAIEESELEQTTTKLQQKLKENGHKLATLLVKRHQIVAPMDGIVVQVNREPGEWVKPGETVFRVFRIDWLRAEGFVAFNKINGDIRNRPVTIVVGSAGHSQRKFHGKVVYVSQEVNPINGQVRIWAEVENTKGQLRPGLQGSMTVHPPSKSSVAPESAAKN